MSNIFNYMGPLEDDRQVQYLTPDPVFKLGDPRALDNNFLQPLDSAALLKAIKSKELNDLYSNPTFKAQTLGLGIAGDLLNKSSDYLLSRTEDDLNVNDVQDRIYGNTWGDIFNQNSRRQKINSTVNNNIRTFDDVRNNANLSTLWDNNDYQFGVNRLSTGEQIGAVGTGIAGGAAKWASTAAMINPMLIAPAAVLGGVFNGVKSLTNVIQGNNTADMTNRTIDRANNIQLNNYFDQARSNRRAMYRNFDEGGPMESLNGLTFFNTGGTHGSNPLGGIPQGVDSEGIPNLVEQGEVKYNDYIFSSRNKISERLLNKYNLPKNLAGKTFAEVATKLQEDSQERPYDPVSMNGLEDSMNKLMAAQEEVRAKKAAREANAFENFNNVFAKGGNTKDPDIPPELAALQKRAQQNADAKRRYEQQYGGQRAKQIGRTLSQMFSLQNLPDPVYLDSYGNVPYRNVTTESPSNTTTNVNLSKETSTQQKESTNKNVKTYIVTSGQRKLRVKATSQDEAKKKAKIYWSNNTTTTDNSSTEYTNTKTSVRISEKGRIPGGSKTNISTTSRKKETTQAPPLVTPEEKPVTTPTQNPPVNTNITPEPEVEPEVNTKTTTTPTPKYRRNPFATAAMMAPAIGSIGQALTDALGWTNRPDYYVEQGLRRNASELNPIAPKLNTDYQEYRPYDVNLMNNQLLAQEYGAQRAARENFNKHTQAAQLLALNNAFGNMGFLTNLQAQQANDAKRNATLQWNHGINRENAATVAAYDEINQGIKQQRLNMLNQAIQAKDASDTARAQVTSANRAAALTDLGSLGRYINDTNLTQALINSGVFGKLNTDMSDAYGNLQLFNWLG